MSIKLLIFLATCFVTLKGQTYDNCGINTNNGRIDLSKMYKPNSEWSFTNQDENLKINICGPVSKKCNGESQPAISEVNGECFAIGKNSIEVKLKDPSNPNSNVQLIYKGGFVIFWPTRAIIEFICDSSDTNFKFLKADFINNQMDYLFEVRSRDACPGGSSRGSLFPVGVGGILLIVGTFLFICYIIIGIIVNRFKFEKQGLEMVPQWYLWRELPFLFKDGIVWTFDGIKIGVFWIKDKVTGNGYQQV